MNSPTTTITTNTNKNEMPMPTSLLDDDLDIGEVDESLKLRMGSAVLVPTKNNLINLRTTFESTTSLEMNNVPGTSPSNNSLDDEDWNW